MFYQKITDIFAECSIDYVKDSELASTFYKTIKNKFHFGITFCSIQENFLKLKNANIMQCCFCYKTIYDGKINDEKFVCKDNNNQVFEWVDLNKLSNIIIKPSSTCKLIQDDRNDIKHIIEFE